MKRCSILLCLAMIALNSCKPSVQYVKPGAGPKLGAESSDDAVAVKPVDATTQGNQSSDGDDNPPQETAGTTPKILNPNPTVAAKSSTNSPDIKVESSDAALDYQWVTTAGPAKLVFNPSNALKTQITATVDGIYTATLIVKNSAGEQAATDIKFVWDTSAPKIVMPDDLRITAPTTIENVAISDLDPHPKLAWRLVGPVAGLTFSDATVLDPVVDSPDPRVYVVALTATDWLGNMAEEFLVVEKYQTGDSGGGGPAGTLPVITVGSNLVTNQTTKPAGMSVEPLDGTSYKWTTGAGPAELSFNASTDLTPEITAPQDGIYAATLTATNGDKSSSRSIILIWDHTPPVVTLATPLKTSYPTAPRVSAADLTPMTYKWQQTSGPGVLTFSALDVLAPVVAGDKAGLYTANLMVTDIAGNQTTETLSFEWTIADSAAPLIEMPAVFSASSPSAPSDVTVTDQDSVVTYLWSKVFGPGDLTFDQANQMQPVIAASQPGDYLARLTAKDRSGNTAVGYLFIRWIDGDTTIPSINLSGPMTISTPTAPDTVTVVDDSSYTLDWTQIQGPPGGQLLFSQANVLKPIISATLPGSYVARLTVTDSAGNQAHRDLSLVWFIPDRNAPVLAMGSTLRISEPTAPQQVQVKDQDGKLRFKWTQVIGPGTLSFSDSNVLYPVISADAFGTYVASLVVTDSQGNVATGILPIVWFKPDSTAPVISSGSPVTIGRPTKLTQIKITDNDPQMTYQWSKVDGPGDVTFQNVGDMQPTISMTVDGTYTVRITATDSAGNASKADLTIVWDRTPPVVFAGAARTQDASSVMADSRVTDTSPTTVSWSVVAKPLPGLGWFSDASTLHPTFYANYPGSYELELSARDALGLTAVSRVIITVDVALWPSTDGAECNQVCSGKQLHIARSPEGATCASGENAIASAFSWVTFKYGFWPNGNKVYKSDASSVGRYCYHSKQKRDNDRTDITVGCFCQ